MRCANLALNSQCHCSISSGNASERASSVLSRPLDGQSVVRQRHWRRKQRGSMAAGARRATLSSRAGGLWKVLAPFSLEPREAPSVRLCLRERQSGGDSLAAVFPASLHENFPEFLQTNSSACGSEAKRGRSEPSLSLRIRVARELHFFGWRLGWLGCEGAGALAAVAAVAAVAASAHGCSARSEPSAPSSWLVSGSTQLSPQAKSF